jgi:hypothetical protein
MDKALPLFLSMKQVLLQSMILLIQNSTKRLSSPKKSASMANAVFHLDFASGIALEDTINQSKKWLGNNILDM